MRTKHIFPLALFLSACGGGGGGGSSSELPGIWNTRMVQTMNDCNLSAPGLDREIRPTYQVNQNGTNVVVDNLASKLTLSGGVTQGGKGFAVSTDLPDPDCPNGSSSLVLAFSNVNDGTADAIFDLNFKCPTLNPPECELVWEGTATKQ